MDPNFEVHVKSKPLQLPSKVGGKYRAYTGVFWELSLKAKLFFLSLRIELGNLQLKRKAGNTCSVFT